LGQEIGELGPVRTESTRHETYDGLRFACP